jgi:glycosyltransferase involved in cell wall biosynthesis
LVSRMKPLGISNSIGFLLKLKPYRFLGWWMEKEACKYADVVVTTSTAMKKQIVSEYRVLEEMIRTIPRGVDVELFKPFPYPKDGRIILTACRLEKEKGVQHLIESMKIVNEKFKDAELWIAGEGKDEAYLRKLAKGKPNIKFLGRISHEEMPSLYAKCSVFALMSSFEPFGAVLLEAMASARPVIAVKSGGPLDIVTDEYGILVDYGDVEQLAEAIADIFMDPGHAGEMGLAGERRVKEKYTWEHESGNYLKIYEKCVVARDSFRQ